MSSKSFRILNNIITKDDIIPISKNTTKVKATEELSNINENDKNNMLSDASTSSDDDEIRTPKSPNADADLLFSPMIIADDNEYEDEYDHGLLSPVYFSAQYPKRFHRQSSVVPSIIASQNVSPTNNVPLGTSPQTSTNNTNDFWKEVKTTNEEAITFTANIFNNGDELLNIVKDNEVLNASTDSSSIDEYVTEDLKQSNVNASLDTTLGVLDSKIKLFSYRNSKGNLKLRTTPSPAFSLKSNSSVSYSSASTSSSSTSTVNNGTHTGMVSTEKSRKVIKGSNKKRNSRLLKNAIRRKSGVWQMVSTGIGIGEFML